MKKELINSLVKLYGDTVGFKELESAIHIAGLAQKLYNEVGEERFVEIMGLEKATLLPKFLTGGFDYSIKEIVSIQHHLGEIQKEKSNLIKDIREELTDLVARTSELRKEVDGFKKVISGGKTE